jgi:hypothetical protein
VNGHDAFSSASLPLKTLRSTFDLIAETLPGSGPDSPLEYCHSVQSDHPSGIGCVGRVLGAAG